MSYRIKRREGLPKGMRRIVKTELERAVEEARDRARPPGARVHQLRARLRRARAAVQLVRSEAGKRARRDDRWMRDLRRGLARARELTVERQTLERLIQRARENVALAPQ